MRTRLLLPLLLLLAACQSVHLERDFDPERDFGAYRTWSWQEPALQYRPADPRLRSDLTEQRMRAAVADQLDQRGLRQAPSGKTGDFRVQVWLIVDQRQSQVTTYSGGYWGNPWYGYWGGPGYGETRTYDYQVGTLQIDFYDSRDDKLVWRGSAQQTLRSGPYSPAERTRMIRETVAKVLSQYPPH